MWGIEVIRRFGTFNYLFLGLISTSFENPHDVISLIVVVHAMKHEHKTKSHDSIQTFH